MGVTMQDSTDAIDYFSRDWHFFSSNHGFLSPKLDVAEVLPALSDYLPLLM